MLPLEATDREEAEADFNARANGVHVATPDKSWYSGLGPGLAGRGFGEGLAQTASAMDAAMAPIREALPEPIQQGLFDKSGEELKQSDIAYHAKIQGIVDSLRPDPTTTGAAGRTLEGFEGVAAQATAGSLVAGPAGAAVVVGGSQGHATYEDLIQQGVDPKTAAEIAGVTGVISGVATVAPVAVPGKILTRVASGAAINTATGAIQRGSSAAILKANGYDEMAKQYQVLDGWGMLGDATLGAFFGALHGTGGIKPQDVTPSQADAAMAVKSAQQYRDSAPGIPADAAAAASHDMAMKTAMEQVLKGEPVNVGGILDGEMLPRQLNPEYLDAWNEATKEAGLDEVAKNLQETVDTLQNNGIPTDKIPSYDFLSALPPREASPTDAAPASSSLSLTGEPRKETSIADTSEGSQPLSESSSTEISGGSERLSNRNIPFSYLKYSADLVPGGKEVSAGRLVDAEAMRDPNGDVVQYQKSNKKETLLGQAERNKPKLEQLLKDLTADVDGATPYREGTGARVKDDNARLAQKILKKDGNAGAISDYLGGAIEVRSPEALAKVMEKLKESGHRILEVDDTLSPEENKNPFAYRAVHVQIELQKGFSAELQILPEQLASIKKDLHGIYTKYRTPEAKEKLANDQAFVDEFNKDVETSRKGFGVAFEKFLGNSRNREGSEPAEPLNAKQAADPLQSILSEKPDLEVTTPEGTFSAKDLVDRMNAEEAEATKLGDLFQVAVNCAMRNT